MAIKKSWRINWYKHESYKEESMDLDSLRCYFSTLRYFEKSAYTPAKWDSMRKAELLINRPVYYRSDGAISHWKEALNGYISPQKDIKLLVF